MMPSGLSPRSYCSPHPRSLRLAATTGIALALGTTYAASDGIPGVVMTDSRYVTDWSGVYIGGRLGGASSNFSWGQDNNTFNTGGGAPANTPVEFSPSGVSRTRGRISA